MASSNTFAKNQSIYGINVQGTGLPVDISEINERKANLEKARMLEEQERSSRIQQSSKWDDTESWESRAASRGEIIKLEEEERDRRLKDSSAEEARRLQAKNFSASIANDILTPTLRITQAARDVMESAKQAGQGLLYGAGSYAYRAVEFFSGLAKEQAQKAQSAAAQVTDKTREQAQLLNEKVTDLSNKGLAQASDIKDKVVDKAFEQVHKAQDLGNKAMEQVQAAKDQVMEKTDQMKSLASQQVQQLSDKAEELSMRAAQFGGWGWTMTTAKLNYLEESERLWRTTGGLDVERFLLALQTTGLVRDWLIEFDRTYSELNEANRWYATSILEDFERSRRLRNKTDSAAWDNSKKLSHMIHLHEIRSSAFRPQAAQLNKVGEVFANRADATFRAQNAKRVAGMVHLNNIRQGAYRPQGTQLKKLDGVYRKKLEQKAATKKAKDVARMIHLNNIKSASHQPQAAQLNKISDVISKKAEAMNAASPARGQAAM